MKLRTYLTCTLACIGLVAVNAQTLFVPTPTQLGQSSNGNVGIGTSTPVDALNINGNLSLESGDALRFYGNSRHSSWASILLDDSERVMFSRNIISTGSFAIYGSANPSGTLTLFSTANSTKGQVIIEPNGGSVGIGTSTPASPMHAARTVGSSSTTSTVATLEVSGVASAVGFGGSLDFQSSNETNQNGFVAARLASIWEGSDNRFGLSLGTRNSGTLGGATSEKVRITSGGNVGVGTSTPANILELAKAETSASIIDSVLQITATHNTPIGSNPFGSAIQFNGSTAGIANESDNAKIAAYSANGNDNGYSLGFFTRPNAQTNSQERLTVDRLGNVGIGTTTPQTALAVNGTITTKEVVVTTTGWADYVFADNYNLTPLSEVERQIKVDKHLPGIPSAADVALSGISLGDMQAKLLAKIEELTLHVIRQEKRENDYQKLITAQAEQIRNLERAATSH